MIKKIKNKEIIEFNRTLSLLLIARISLINSLELIDRGTKNDELKKIIIKIIKDLKKGMSFSDSLLQFPNYFSNIYIANVKIGEETGNLADVLVEFSSYQEKFEELKQKIALAIRYPIFILVVTFLAVFFMLFFLIPTFESLFKSLQSEIPPITKYLLNISNLMTNYWYVLLISFIILIFLIIKIKSSENIKRNYLDAILLKIPYFNTLFKQNLLARFSLSMGFLLKNGIGIVEALSISKNITNNSFFHKEISKIMKNITKGKTITENINNSIFFDMNFRKLISAGEESAELSNVFYLTSNYYSKEFDYKLKNLMTLVEPVLIVIIGLIVAIILVAMYLPMFELINFMD